MNQLPNFLAGIRISLFDACVLSVGLLAAVLAARVEFWFGIVIAFVVLHFFLFCNVILIARAFELIWACCFVLLATSTILTGIPSWPVTLAVSFAVTCILVVIEIRKPNYQGLRWRKPESPSENQSPDKNQQI